MGQTKPHRPPGDGKDLCGDILSVRIAQRKGPGGAHNRTSACAEARRQGALCRAPYAGEKARGPGRELSLSDLRLRP